MRFTKIFRIAFLFIIVFLWFFASTYADIIYLQNGNRIEGEILSETDEHLEIRVKMGEAKVNRDDIESVEKKELPEGFFDEEEVPIEETGEEELEAEVEVEEEEKGEEIQISVEAEFLTVDARGAVDIKGETNLPDGALIYVFLKRRNKYIDSREIPVKDNKFSVRFGPFERKLPFGKYRIDADFMPDRQPQDIGEKLGTEEMELIEAAYILSVGSDEEIEESKKMMESEIEYIIANLQNLYKELDDNYKKNLSNPDLNAWDMWAKDWLFRMDELERKAELRRLEYSIPLFPEAEDAVRQAAFYLSYLGDVYSMKFKDPESFSMFYDRPDARIKPQDLNGLFTGSLIRARKVLHIRD